LSGYIRYDPQGRWAPAFRDKDAIGQFAVLIITEAEIQPAAAAAYVSAYLLPREAKQENERRQTIPRWTRRRPRPRNEGVCRKRRTPR